MMSEPRQITIKQVARQAGVSTQTVSRVLNNRPDVAPETRERVQQVINKLGYTPSAVARSLIRRQSQTLGVVMAELGHYGPMRRLMGIKEGADELGYSLNLSLMHHPDQNRGEGEQLIADLLSWHVDGIIWAVPEVGDRRAWLKQQIDMAPVPMVFVSEQALTNDLAVSVDNRAGGFLATTHLLTQGYRHIGLITGPPLWVAAQERRLGWQDALPAWDERQIFAGDWSAASGERGLRRLLQAFPEMDAVFAGNDQMALGVLQVAHQMGLHVPEDLGVIGFDNTPESGYYYPPLTTVRHRLAEQGKIAVQQLIGMIESRRLNGVPQPADITVLQPQLIIRKSSTVVTRG